ncbi:Elongation of fatty acids protein 2 [Mortierella sp. 14UC]|nr:Elongation of fatty acids protein 2 [Mortierella sp. 14UC]
MGVKGLTNLLQRLAPDAVRTHRISHYKGKTLAIDVSCFLNRFIYSLDAHPARVQRGLYRLCLYFRLNDIRPIFVFDGPTRIVEKEHENKRREVMKEKVKKSFQLEKNRKSRLKGLKGSAQIMKELSPEQVVSIMEEIRIRENGHGDSVGGSLPVAAAASGASEVEVEDDVAVHNNAELAVTSLDSGATEAAPKPRRKKQSAKTPQPDKTAQTTKSASDSRGLSPQQDLHLATIYDLLEEDPIWIDDENSWTIPSLPDEFYRRLEQEHAKLLASSNSYNSTSGFEDQLLADALDVDEDEGRLEDIDVFERELDMLDRMELDIDTIGGMDVIYDLSDQATATIADSVNNNSSHPLPLVLRTGTSIESFLSPSDNNTVGGSGTEDEAAYLRKRVHTALEEYVRLTDKSTENVEEDELTVNSTRKQRALDELEQKLVQGIRQYTGINADESRAGSVVELESRVDPAMDIMAQVDPVVEIDEVVEMRSETPPQTQEISSAQLETPTTSEAASIEEPTAIATTTIEDLIPEMATTEGTEPIWSVDSDSVDTAAMKQVDPTVIEDASGPDQEDSEAATTETEEGDLDLKTMIHSVLSAHQSILMTLERRTMRVTWPLVVSCQRLLVAMGEPVVEAKDAEAEAVCARLTTLGLADASVSEDTDTAVFGNGLLLRQVGATGGRGIIEINPVLAREGLGLNRDAFRDLCILCGTDFSGTIEGIGANRAAKLIQYFGSIESIMANTDYKPRPDFFYDRARRVFDRTPAVPLDPSAYQPKPDIQPLLLELLLKYDINPEEVKQELINDIKAEEMGLATEFGETVKAASEAAFSGNGSMGIDPFKATAIKLPSFGANSSPATLPQ